MYFKSKNGIAINVDASTKNIYLKKYIWSPAKCSYKKWEIIRKCYWIIGSSVVICDEIIDEEAKSYNEETKTIPITFNNNKKEI